MSGQLVAATAPFNPLWSMILAPVVGALVVILMPERRSVSVRHVALLAAAVSGGLSVYLATQFERGVAGFQFVTRTEFSDTLGISWHLGVDGISLFLLVLTGILFPLAIAGVDPDHDARQYYAWLLVLMAGSMGVFVALDLVVFFLFFEIVLVPMYFLIGLWGHGDRIYAATKFFLYTMFGSAFMFVGVIGTAVLHQRAAGGALTFDLVEIAESQSIGVVATRWLFASFAIAFAVKVPLFPLHTWLPDAHTEAPTAGSVILAGVMLKLGTYGLIRFGLYLFPAAAHDFAPVLLTVGVIGIVYGAVVATMQGDLKRLVAYSSIAHLGFIVVGIFAFNTEGITGGVLQMVNHGITTPALFLLVGMIYERRHTRQISELRGLQTPAPHLAAVFTLVMLASIGLPGLNGFVGEFLTLLGGFAGARWWAVVGASGVIVAALYLLWAYQRVFHGTPDEANADMADLTWREGLVLAPLCVLIVFLGVYPAPVIDRIEPSVRELMDHVVSVEPDAAGAEIPAPPTGEEDHP